jgi:antitoxin VapB
MGKEVVDLGQISYLLSSLVWYIFVVYIIKEVVMPKTAKLFKNGQSQAVRLPAEFRFSGREVFIEKQGDKVILRPKPIGWDDFFADPPRVPADFLTERIDTPPEKKDLF